MTHKQLELPDRHPFLERKEKGGEREQESSPRHRSQHRQTAMLTQVVETLRKKKKGGRGF